MTYIVRLRKTISSPVEFTAFLTMEHDVYVPPGPKWYCPVVNLLKFSCFLCSTSFILSLTFDRFYSIIMPHKAASFNTVKRAKITVACITIISFLYNVPHFYLSSNVSWECVLYGKENVYSFGELYYWLSFVVQFALPFVLLLVMNSIIIHKIRTRFKNPSISNSIGDSNQGENSAKTSELQVFAILLLVTFAFLILTTPGHLLFLFVMAIDFFATPRLFATYYLFYHVSHKIYITNYGINFYLYVISGRKFRRDLKNLFPDFKKHSKCDKQMISTIENGTGHRSTH